MTIQVIFDYFKNISCGVKNNISFSVYIMFYNYIELFISLFPLYKILQKNLKRYYNFILQYMIIYIINTIEY